LVFVGICREKALNVCKTPNLWLAIRKIFHV